MSLYVAQGLHKKYIKQTEKDAIVYDVTALLGHLTVAVCEQALRMQQKNVRVYINTRVLKHTYDKRPAQEYDFLVENLLQIVRYPDIVYKNRAGKRGDYCFVKILKNRIYLCCLEEIMDGDFFGFQIVTFYRVPKEKYLDNYESLWSWGDDKNPHRSTFDSGEPA